MENFGGAMHISTIISTSALGPQHFRSGIRFMDATMDLIALSSSALIVPNRLVPRTLCILTYYFRDSTHIGSPTIEDEDEANKSHLSMNEVYKGIQDGGAISVIFKAFFFA